MCGSPCALDTAGEAPGSSLNPAHQYARCFCTACEVYNPHQQLQADAIAGRYKPHWPGVSFNKEAMVIMHVDNTLHDNACCDQSR
jgi:hypothetical protein